jgi:hypothetical protein
MPVCKERVGQVDAETADELFLIQNCDMQRVGLTSQRLRDNGTRSKYANGSRDYMRATIVKTSAIIRKQHRF